MARRERRPRRSEKTGRRDADPYNISLRYFIPRRAGACSCRITNRRFAPAECRIADLLLPMPNRRFAPAEKWSVEVAAPYKVLQIRFLISAWCRPLYRQFKIPEKMLLGDFFYPNILFAFSVSSASLSSPSFLTISFAPP